jgi:hypothetical protein
MAELSESEFVMQKTFRVRYNQNDTFCFSCYAKTFYKMRVACEG